LVLMWEFSLKKKELRKAGLTEADFDGISKAFTSLWDKFEIPKMEADLVFKYCGKETNQGITEEEYVKCKADPELQAKMSAELQEKLAPALAHLTVELQSEMRTLVARVMAKGSRR